MYTDIYKQTDNAIPALFLYHQDSCYHSGWSPYSSASWHCEVNCFDLASQVQITPRLEGVSDPLPLPATQAHTALVDQLTHHYSSSTLHLYSV